MTKQELLQEFLHEGENTRKLLNAVTDDVLNWRPAEKNWTTAELSSHIAAMYAWYPEVINQTELVIDNYKYEREDYSRAANIVAKFEENFEKAREAVESYDEAKAAELWSLIKGDYVAIPPSPKAGIIRTLLCNHVYHHRGQLVTYLRSNGLSVPGLYGPTADGVR